MEVKGQEEREKVGSVKATEKVRIKKGREGRRSRNKVETK